MFRVLFRAPEARRCLVKIFKKDCLASVAGLFLGSRKMQLFRTFRVSFEMCTALFRMLEERRWPDLFSVLRPTTRIYF